jgi:hypothetical protein
MDSASSLAYPGSRILAGWWRQLQPFQPSAVWVGHLFIHRVEALVEIIEPRPVDALALCVLQALAVDQDHRGGFVGDRAEALPGRLHLPAPAVQQLLLGMQGRELVRRGERGSWSLSERGRAALQARADHTPRRERRVFPFVERLTSAGRRVAPPHFLPLAECPAIPWSVDEGHRFDAALLTESPAQPADWRERVRFPPGIARIITAGDSDANGAWERVIVDRPERAAVAMVTTAGHELLAFAADMEEWSLHVDAPVLRVGESVRELLVEVPQKSTWEEAWRLWCRQRHFPRSEAEACRLQCDGLHLQVQAPESFVQRLEAAKSDLVRDEAGLLAGDGYLRATALLRLVAG